MVSAQAWPRARVQASPACGRPIRARSGFTGDDPVISPFVLAFENGYVLMGISWDKIYAYMHIYIYMIYVCIYIYESDVYESGPKWLKTTVTPYSIAEYCRNTFVRCERNTVRR